MISTKTITRGSMDQAIHIAICAVSGQLASILAIKQLRLISLWESRCTWEISWISTKRITHGSLDQAIHIAICAVSGQLASILAIKKLRLICLWASRCAVEIWWTSTKTISRGSMDKAMYIARAAVSGQLASILAI